MKKEYFEKYEADMDSPLCKNCGPVRSVKNV